MEEKLTDTDTALFSVLGSERYTSWMKRILQSRDMMLRILVVRLAGLLRISSFQRQIITLMRENPENLNLQYAGFLALSMMGNRDSIVRLCAEPGNTKLLSYRSLKEILASYTGSDIRVLYGELLHSQDVYIRRIIVKNIGDEGFAEHAPALMKMLDSEDFNLLCDVVRTLGQLHIREAGRYIVPMMRSQHWQLRNVAAVALANIDARAYLPSLMDGLRDREWWVRYNSAHELCTHLPLAELETIVPTLNDRFASEILQFAIQESRMMGKGVNAE